MCRATNSIFVSPERVHTASWRQVLGQPALVVWALYIFLIPFYVFKSGLPQPGDLFVVILVPVALRRWSGKLTRTARDAFRPLLWFTIWVCLVDYGWAIVEGNFRVFGTDSFLLFPVYYIYNACVFLVSLVLYQRYGNTFLRLTLYIIIGTVFVQTMSSLVLRSGTLRSTLFFNNPNQLGYYALLSATLIALTHRRLQIRLLIAGLALTGCGYLALISASRAAVGGVAILFALVVFSNPRVIIVTSILAAGLLTLGGPVAHAIDSYEQRSEMRHSSEGFFADRGYDRVWEHEDYLLLGAGEGGFNRFSTEKHGNMELHSTPGTLLFCYGIVGTVLFLVWLWRVVRGARLRAALMLAPPMMYTIAHQGLRFTMLWVLAAIFVTLKDPIPIRRPAPAIAT